MIFAVNGQPSALKIAEYAFDNVTLYFFKDTIVGIEAASPISVHSIGLHKNTWAHYLEPRFRPHPLCRIATRVIASNRT